MEYAAYLLLGLVVGFFAGLFGIGGGLILVPVLSLMFAAQQLAPSYTLQLALGTSMAAILFSAAYSSYAHHQHGAVEWRVVRRMAWGLLLGAGCGSYLVTLVQTRYLAIFFALFVYVCAAQMLLNIKPVATRQLPGRWGLGLAGCGIGCISSLVSVGGGVMSVPYLLYHNVVLKRAIATSAALGLPIACGGTLGYVLMGWASVPGYMLGFVYWPAVLLLALGSFFTTRLGAKTAHKLPLEMLRRGFALLLCVLASKMLWALV